MTKVSSKQAIRVIGTVLAFVLVLSMLTLQPASARSKHKKRGPQVDRSYAKVYKHYRGSLGKVKSKKHKGLKSGGAYQSFSKGKIYSSRHSRPNPVYGSFLSAYRTVRYERGVLGYPTGGPAKSRKRTGQLQRFQGGYITSRSRAGTRVLSGSSLRKWKSLGWEGGKLGYPNGADHKAGKGGGYYQSFEKGILYRSSYRGSAYMVAGGIRTAYSKQRSERGALGYPTSDERALRGGSYQSFQGGLIYYSRSGGAHIVRPSSSIGKMWKQSGSEGGALGYPKSNEFSIAGGTKQNFVNGDIYWSSKTRKTAIMMNKARITAEWAKAGSYKGSLGFPEESAKKTIRDGDKQSFDNGIIVQNPYTKVYYTVKSPFKEVWTKARSESGDLSFPLANQTKDSTGAVSQKFGGGSVYQSGYGTFAVSNDFRDEMDRQGGKLGYPIEDIFINDSGITQKFLCGTVSYNSSQGTSSALEDCATDKPVDEPKPTPTTPPQPTTPPTTPTPTKPNYKVKGARDTTAESSKAFFAKYNAIRTAQGYSQVPTNRFITGGEDWKGEGASSLENYYKQCRAETERYRDQGVAGGHHYGRCNSDVNAYSSFGSQVDGDLWAKQWWTSLGHRANLYGVKSEKFWEPTADRPNGLCLTYHSDEAWDGWTDPQDEFHFERAVASWVVCPTPR